MSRLHILLSLILLVGLAIRIPGIFWGNIDRSDGIVLEPDEFQHIALAADYVHHWGGEAGQDLPYRFWNTRAFGFQLGGLIFIAEKLGFEVSYLTKHALLGRFFSTFYALLLIYLIFHLGCLLFEDQRIGLLAAALFAVFDLHITYSHYALPSSAYLFWTHLSLLLMFRYYYHLSGKKVVEHPTQLELMLGASLALVFGLKFDFLPFLLLGSILLVSWRQKLIHFSSLLLRSFRITTVVLLCFPIIHGFAFSWEDFVYSFQVAQSFNQNAIPQDNHWLHNPILYLFALMGGTSIWVLLGSVLGSVVLLGQASNTFKISPLWIFLFLFVSMEFAIRWFLDTPFIRRANIFLPFVAITTAWYIMEKLSLQNTKKLAVIGLILLYTLGIAFYGQSNFWQDTRYEALPLIKELGEHNKVYYSTYAKTPGMPEPTVTTPQEADILVVHETYYGRYWKYFTTPFKIPNCCDQVYNCANEERCTFYQELLSNTSTFELLETFPTQHPFPERRLFKRLFGTYETFLGDIKIYKQAK